MKTHREQRFCGPRIYEGVTNSGKRVTLVGLGMLVDVWKVWAAVNSERPRETEVGCGISGGLERYISG